MPSVPDITKLKSTITAFKESLKLSSDKIRETEQSMREQHHSDTRFSACHYLITASRFGDILHRQPITPSDALVRSILQPETFSSAATTITYSISIPAFFCQCLSIITLGLLSLNLKSKLLHLILFPLRPCWQPVLLL